MASQEQKPDFGFMLNNQPARRRLPLPSLNLPRPVKIVLGVVIAIFVLVIISSLLSGRKSGSFQPVVGVMAREQEILRITILTQQLQLQDPQAQALAATVTSSLTSDQQQFSTYLAQNKFKPSPTQLAADTDKSSDNTLQTASQNNTLDSAYEAYLKSALGQYLSDLQTAYKSAGPNGKRLLSGSFDSAQTILNSPPLKS